MSRLFFALWPDDAVRVELARYRLDVARACEGRAVRAETLHITLVFIGEVPEARVAELAACADRVTARAFNLLVDTAGCFAMAHVAWLGCSQPPAALFDLESALRSEAVQASFNPDARPFKAHVTVARNLGLRFKRRQLPGIHWPVKSFNLIESVPTESGPSYKILRTWALSSPPVT
jgi:RNA 2',3'-cyclic 3'-phosphodiesterase